MRPSRRLYGELAADAGLCVADDPAAAELLAAFVNRLVAQSGGPTSLSECGVNEQLIPTLAAKATEQWTGKFNPPVTAQQFEELYNTHLPTDIQGKCVRRRRRPVARRATASGCLNSQSTPLQSGSTTGEWLRAEDRMGDLVIANDSASSTANRDPIELRH